MQNPPDGMRLCPTRTDLSQTLIAHTISQSECQKRQREHFHRCPTCVHQNNRASEPVPKLAAVIDMPRAIEPAGAPALSKAPAGLKAAAG